MRGRILIEKEAKNFLDKVFQTLEQYDSTILTNEIDHLCYRTSSIENYINTKAFFSELGHLLIESEINGRPIATYKLHAPLIYRNWIIDLIEVPAPKKNRITKEGFEHLEVVIDEDFDSFVERHSQFTFIKDGLKKELNPEIEVEFTDFAIKFHHKSLEHVINIEKNPKITNFLDKSQILRRLAHYSPLISGTLPLNIGIEKSDLDILFQTDDLKKFNTEVTHLFGAMKGFKVKHSLHQNHDSLIISFQHENLAIEFFCQNKSVYKQSANQHFLIEGRLLKLFGEKLRTEILSLKNKGVKTEPAFGKLLSLSDPYKELIEMNDLTDSQLKEKLKNYILK